MKDSCSLYEFSGIFDVEKSDDEIVMNSDKGHGRAKNLRLNFQDTHPQFTSRFLRLRSKQFIPNICGRVSYHPGPIPVDFERRNAWWKKMQSWARYCLVTFIPWGNDISDRLSDPVRTIHRWIQNIQSAKTSMGISLINDRKWSTELGRFQFILNTTVTMRQLHVERSLCSAWRARTADKWKDYGTHAPRDMEVTAQSKALCLSTLRFVQQLLQGQVETDGNDDSRRDRIRCRLSALTSGIDRDNGKREPFFKPAMATKEDIDANMTSIVEDADQKSSNRVTQRNKPPKPLFPHKVLTDDQMYSFELVDSWLSSGMVREPPLICLLGAPGSGKSEVARALVNKYPSAVVTCAFCGSAAHILKGDTINSLFRISTPKKEGGLPHLSVLDNAALTALKLQWANTKVLVIDEISQCTDRLLGLISTRLAQLKTTKKPWGGLCVVLQGDFLQLPPTFGLPLYKGSSSLFSQFSVKTLAGQHRSKSERHSQNIAILRDMKEDFPMQKVDWSLYRYISASDLESEFEEAVHVVATNAERGEVNEIISPLIAAKKGTIAFKWRILLPSALLQHAECDEQVWERLGDHPEFFQYFVKGAEAFLSKNLATTRGLCNGTPCVLETFGYWDPRKRELYELAVRNSSAPVTLIPTPDFIRVKVDGIRKFVPLVCKEMRVSGLKESLTVTRIPFDIGIAVTCHKIQGRTIKKLVIHLSRTMSLAAILVSL